MLLLTETLTLLVRRLVDFFLQIIILAVALKYILVMDESSVLFILLVLVTGVDQRWDGKSSRPLKSMLDRCVFSL